MFRPISLECVSMRSFVATLLNVLIILLASSVSQCDCILTVNTISPGNIGSIHENNLTHWGQSIVHRLPVLPTSIILPLIHKFTDSVLFIYCDTRVSASSVCWFGPHACLPTPSLWYQHAKAHHDLSLWLRAVYLRRAKRLSKSLVRDCQ